MAELRFFRGWSEQELRARLEDARSLPRNFTTPFDEMTLERGWNHYFSDSVIASEGAGPPAPDGPFQRAWVAMQSYHFSDPRTVTGHFDPSAPLLGRTMLLEIKSLVMHYLCGVRVGAVREEDEPTRTVRGWRYDTLRGHFEIGAEWFLLTKDHDTGAVRFRVSANWRPGEFPNWWSRLGFQLFGARYQRSWHHRAHARLALLARHGSATPPRPARGAAAHAPPRVDFQFFRGVRGPRRHTS